MKKCFFVTLGIASGLALILAILGGVIYWWNEVRVPEPPNISVELDGFPDGDEKANNEQQAKIRIVITNNDKTRLDFDDAYLYLTRFDGARTNIKYEVDNFILYPNEKYVEVVSVTTGINKGVNFKSADDFETKEDFIAYRNMWISQLKETFGFNYTFISDTHNIRILLNVEKELAEIEAGLTEETNRRWMEKQESKAQEAIKAVDVTVDEKIKTLRLEAERGDAVAQFNLGISYAQGKVVPKDAAEAVKWCRKAAEQGYAKAQFNLGSCYSFGAGVSEDDAEAVKWFRMAAEQGDVDAQYSLGVCYAKGEGVPEDDAEAVKWFRKAAEEGYAKAQYNLGICYAKGEGAPKDDAEAVKWYRKAAEQGDVDAQYDLGICYAKGKGAPKDDVAAYMWFNLASRKGDNDAVKKMAIISERMTDEQITQALNLSSEWIENHKK
jgi:TPR repeat protein